MQNELKTNTSGTVTTIHVQEGATVETGTVLITVVAPEARVLEGRLAAQVQASLVKKRRHNGD
jgi:pyruvate/2-oxoglutarate dehydrogenase complex dihydrolipoamide acyltransferase (E2) component